MKHQHFTALSNELVFNRTSFEYKIYLGKDLHLQLSSETDVPMLEFQVVVHAHQVGQLYNTDLSLTQLNAENEIKHIQIKETKFMN